MTIAAGTQTVDGNVWEKKFLDDRSGHWFELGGDFGELIVEEHASGEFRLSWWPPGVTQGEPVTLGSRATRRGAMKAAVAYLRKLGRTLGATKRLPC